MKIVLFDNLRRHWLEPFTKTKPVSALFMGMYTNLRRWEIYTGAPVFAMTTDWLQPGWPLPADASGLLYIDGAVLPDAQLVQAILQLHTGEALYSGEQLLAARSALCEYLLPLDCKHFSQRHTYPHPVKQLQYPWHIFQYNADLIRSDFHQSKGLASCRPAPSNRLTAAKNIIAGAGLRMEHCILNASDGPIVIGEHVTILEGTVIFGPCFIGDYSVVKAGTKIYGGSIGHHCTVGGELKNSIVMPYSNKAHDGYLGDAVVGEWCNLGAGTSNSNVRNDAADIMLPIDGKPVNAGLKCGLLMGDYTRCAINTSFNTATMAGVAGNIFGTGLTPRVLPDFTWGYTDRYHFDKAVEHISNWKRLKQQVLGEHEFRILDHLYRSGL